MQNRFVGHVNVDGILVGFGVDGDRRNSEIAAGAA